jgi:hypothetical protein
MSILLKHLLAGILSSFADGFPRVEREVRVVLDGLSSNLFVVFIVEG